MYIYIYIYTHIERERDVYQYACYSSMHRDDAAGERDAEHADQEGGAVHAPLGQAGERLGDVALF